MAVSFDSASVYEAGFPEQEVTEDLEHQVVSRTHQVALRSFEQDKNERRKCSLNTAKLDHTYATEVGVKISAEWGGSERPTCKIDGYGKYQDQNGNSLEAKVGCDRSGKKTFEAEFSHKEKEGTSSQNRERK